MQAKYLRCSLRDLQESRETIRLIFARKGCHVPGPELDILVGLAGRYFTACLCSLNQTDRILVL